MFRKPFRSLIAMTASAAAHLAFAGAAFANDCDRYEHHRDAYLYRAGAAMSQAVTQMAQQRNVPVEAAAFYWGGDLMRAGDPASMRSLALLTLASYEWEGHETRAEAALERMFADRGQVYAGFLAGLMLSDDRGPADPYRARAYLRDAADAGSTDADAFLALFDACHGRAMAFN